MNVGLYSLMCVVRCKKRENGTRTSREKHVLLSYLWYRVSNIFLHFMIHKYKLLVFFSLHNRNSFIFIGQFQPRLTLFQNHIAFGCFSAHVRYLRFIFSFALRASFPVYVSVVRFIFLVILCFVRIVPTSNNTFTNTHNLL